MGIRRGGDGQRDEGGRPGYRYRPLDAVANQSEPQTDATAEAAGAVDAPVDDDTEAAFGEDGGEDEEYEDGEDDEPESEFWPAADLLIGATIEDAELELSYEASVYANLPAAEFRLWLKLPDGTSRLVQIDEPHAVWLYRAAHKSDTRDFEEFPDHRFELLCTDIRATRARRMRQLIDRQAALHSELMAVGEELEELERDMREDEGATADWPGARWP